MANQKVGEQHPNSGNYAPLEEATWQNAAYPLGAHYQEEDVTFAVYSKRATRILLEIYLYPTEEDAKYDYWLKKNPQDNIWRAKIAKLPPGSFYAFRGWGPNWEYQETWHRGNCNIGFKEDVDDQGNRFNPNKVLYDPYAREMSHDKTNPAMLAAGEDGEMYCTGSLDYHGCIKPTIRTSKCSIKKLQSLSILRSQ